MSRKKKANEEVPVSILLPGPLQQAVIDRSVKEDRSFSAVVRRALRKELGMREEEQTTRAA